MKTKFISWVTVIIAFAVILFNAGCSKDERSSLLEHAPLDAQNVMLLNIKNIVLQSGGDISPDGRLLPTDDFVSLLVSHDEASQALIDVLCTTAPFIDCENLMRYQPAGNEANAVIVFEITDATKLKDALSKIADGKESVHGYDIFTMNQCAVAIKKEKGWISRDIQEAMEIENSIDNNSYASYEPLREFFDYDSHDVEIVFNNIDNNRTPIQYTTLIGSVKNNGIYVDMQFMDKEGNYFSFKDYIHAVDRDLVSYMPSQTQALFAIGDVDDWSKIFVGIENLLPPDIVSPYMLYFALAKEYISQIDGTTLVAFAPIAGRQSLKMQYLNTWEVLVMSHFKPEKTDEIISMAINFLQLQGFKVDEMSKGIYRTQFNGNELMFGTVNGYIFASNYNIFTQGGNTTIGQYYEGKRAMAELLIPYGSETMKAYDLPWGLDVNVYLTSASLSWVLRLPGSNGPVLKDIVEYVSTKNAEDLSSYIDD